MAHQIVNVDKGIAHNATIAAGDGMDGRWRALVLNADYRPLSYYPLSTWNWKDAVRAICMDRVHIVAEYEKVVRSPSIELRLPSVLCLKNYISLNRSPVFTRFNVFLRDGFACVYCGETDDLTFDHLLPRSKGGKTSWTNIVTACGPCNLRKGRKSPGEVGLRMPYKPHKPSSYELMEMGRRFPPNYLHESWLDFLYWDVELEP